MSNAAPFDALTVADAFHRHAAAFEVSQLEPVTRLHEHHHAGAIDRATLVRETERFFAERHDLVTSFHDQLRSTIRDISITGSHDARYGSSDESEMHEQLPVEHIVAFLSDERHLAAFERMLTQRLANQYHEPADTHRWLGQLDTTLGKLKNLVALYRAHELHRAPREHHPTIHARHEVYFDRLHALHTRVRAEIKQIECLLDVPVRPNGWPQDHDSQHAQFAETAAGWHQRATDIAYAEPAIAPGPEYANGMRTRETVLLVGQQTGPMGALHRQAFDRNFKPETPANDTTATPVWGGAEIVPLFATRVSSKKRPNNSGSLRGGSTQR